MAGISKRKQSLNPISLRELRRQRKRTGLASQAILGRVGGIDGLTPAMIDNWLSGNQAFASREHFEAVLMAYIKQPDTLAEGQGPDRVKVTAALRSEIREIHGRSANGYLEFAPQSFSASQLSQLLNGWTKTLSVRMLEFFRKDALAIAAPNMKPPYPPEPDLVGCVTLPVRMPRKYSRRSLPKGVVYIDIDHETHQELHGEIARTRVSPRLLLKSVSDVPKGLTAQMVRSWHNGRIQSAEPHYLAFVLDEYRKLPNSAITPAPK